MRDNHSFSTRKPCKLRISRRALLWRSQWQTICRASFINLKRSTTKWRQSIDNFRVKRSSWSANSGMQKIWARNYTRWTSISSLRSTISKWVSCAWANNLGRKSISWTPSLTTSASCALSTRRNSSMGPRNWRTPFSYQQEARTPRSHASSAIQSLKGPFLWSLKTSRAAFRSHLLQMKSMGEGRRIKWTPWTWERQDQILSSSQTKTPRMSRDSNYNNSQVMRAATPLWWVLSMQNGRVPSNRCQAWWPKRCSSNSLMNL